ncbi:MAG TPA: nucleotide exchange factor GrpE [Candidatus Nitrosocosmicus sp.]|nr:nucleotide exchange factor GrpE [Candidatus Nitrosocosmicus sp.]
MNDNKKINDEDIEETISNDEQSEEAVVEEVDPEAASNSDIDKSTIEAAKVEIEHWKNKYVRALADYENLEKRMADHVQILQIKSKKQLLNKFLDILDTIYQAEIFIKDPGLKMVKDNFLKILQEEQVKEMNLLGKEYDPYLAEAIEVVEDEKNKDKVVEVVSKGYMIGDDIIRIARVKVGK